jgi:hypothetical protein
VPTGFDPLFHQALGYQTPVEVYFRGGGGQQEDIRWWISQVERKCLAMKRFEQIVEGSQKQMAQGASRDELIASLHAQGVSIIESIKVVRILYHVNLRDAKSIVTAHPVWADLVQRWDPIHAALLEEFEKETRERKD